MQAWMAPEHQHVKPPRGQFAQFAVPTVSSVGIAALEQPSAQPQRVQQPRILAQVISSFRHVQAGLEEQFSRHLGNRRDAMGIPTPQLDLGGRWQKDKAASDMDGYSRSLELMGIRGLKKKTAMVLMDGVELEVDSAGLTTKFVTKVPQWRPTEVYSFGGPSQMSRRDQRKGQQTAVVTTTEDSVEVSVTWGAPNPGGFTETYRMPEPGVLHIESVTTIDGATASSLQVYRKHGE